MPTVGEEREERGRGERRERIRDFNDLLIHLGSFFQTKG
jgi:hypothetical protein